MIEDILYYITLLVCVTLGNYYKKIQDVETKRNFGAGLGILIACIVCGHHIYHSIFMVWGNIIIIKYCNKRVIHKLSFVFTWVYLIYLYYNLNNLYVFWLYQSMALKLVGLAFEVNIAERHKSDSRTKYGSTKVVPGDSGPIDPSTVDIVTYAYFFIGLHKGPYYTWKIFNDHFTAPFSKLGDCRVITEQKLKKALICAVGYSLLRMKYSISGYSDEDLYYYYGSDFRFMYNLPHLVMYFFKCQMLMLFCTSVCTETGFGVYPAKCLPLPGQGPTAQFSLLKMIAGSPESALQQEYNFLMIKCFENDKLMMGPKMKDTLRAWDMPTQYWFWSNIYKNFLRSNNKELRSAFSFMAWTIWTGPSMQNIISSSTLWIYVHLESEYALQYDTNGAMKGPWDIGFSIMRMLCLIYLTPCFVLDDSKTVFKYYNSIYWAYHIVLLVLILASIILNKNSSRLQYRLRSQLYVQSILRRSSFQNQGTATTSTNTG